MSWRISAGLVLAFAAGAFSWDWFLWQHYLRFPLGSGYQVKVVKRGEEPDAQRRLAARRDTESAR